MRHNPIQAMATALGTRKKLFPLLLAFSALLSRDPDALERVRALQKRFASETPLVLGVTPMPVRGEMGGSHGAQ